MSAKLIHLFYFSDKQIMSNSKKQTFFNQKWLEEAEFKNWLVAIKRIPIKEDVSFAAKTLTCLIGRQPLVSHASGKTHALHDVKVQTFFKAPASKASKTCQETSISTGGLTSSSSSSKTQSSLQLVVTNAEENEGINYVGD